MFDDTLPVSASSVVEARNTVLAQHGGIFSRIQYDSVRIMSADEFRKGAQADSDCYTVVRDASGMNLTEVYRGTAIQYHVTSYANLPLDMMAEEVIKFGRDKGTVYRGDTLFPKLYSRTLDGKTVVSVLVRSMCAPYSMTGILRDFKPLIWYPDFIMSVSLVRSGDSWAISGDYNPIAAGVVKDLQYPYENAEVLHMPFPNFHSDGAMCIGSTNVQSEGSRTLDDCLNDAVNTIIMGNHNTDLMGYLSDAVCPRDIPYASTKRKAAYEEEKGRHSTEMQRFLDILATLENPGGWRLVRTQAISGGAKTLFER